MSHGLDAFFDGVVIGEPPPPPKRVADPNCPECKGKGKLKAGDIVIRWNKSEVEEGTDVPEETTRPAFRQCACVKEV